MSIETDEQKVDPETLTSPPEIPGHTVFRTPSGAEVDRIPASGRPNGPPTEDPTARQRINADTARNQLWRHRH